VSPVNAVTARAPAKVNLQLAVGPPRDDGYHDVVTVYHAVSLFDEVTVAPAERDSMTVTGEGAGSVPTDAGNLAFHAAGALVARVGPGCMDSPGLAIQISKRIPVAAGLAGGSADAAATLVACNELWGTGLSQAQLCEVAAGIGSDVAFALVGGTAIGVGRGERVTPALATGSFHWVLAFAADGLSTAQVYAAFDRIRASQTRPPGLGTGTAREGAPGGASAAGGGAPPQAPAVVAAAPPPSQVAAARSQAAAPPAGPTARSRGKSRKAAAPGDVPPGGELAGAPPAAGPAAGGAARVGRASGAGGHGPLAPGSAGDAAPLTVPPPPGGAAGPALDHRLMAALRSGDPAELGPLLSNDLQPAALSLRPDLRRALAAGREYGALGAIVSGSGPTCMYLARDARHARDLAVALAGAGVCRTVAHVSGPVPGALVTGTEAGLL
jgi:4-diphosphocytidyl-2-C-methyl-D-erythritol kinase